MDFYTVKDKSYFNHTRPELLKYIPSNIKKVLDVGCANGNFGAMLKEIYNCEVWGVEPNHSAVKIAAEKLDYVINSSFKENILQLSNQKFDCIFFNDVLEHLEYPEKALNLAYNYLHNDGLIIASIPNIRYYPVVLSLLRYKDFKYVESGVMDKTHLRFFTKKSMISLFEDAEYSVQLIEGINRSHFNYLEILNFLLRNKIEDMRYPQFAIVAKKNE